MKVMFHAAAALVVSLLTFTAPASATTIERVVSPGGIEAWLVHEPAIPLIAIDFAFTGGAVQDPAGKAGMAQLVASLLDDGVGDFDSKTFPDRLERKAIELRFSADRETLRGSMRTLTEEIAMRHSRICALSLNAPRFDASDVELDRAQILSTLRRATTSPNDIANRRWWGGRIPRPSLWPAGQWHGRVRTDDHHRRPEVVHATRRGARQSQSRHRRRYRCR